MTNQSEDTQAFIAFTNSDEMLAFRKEMADAPARSVSIVGLALVEDQLRVLLDKGTIPRPGIESFSTDRQWGIDDLNRLAHRLGLIDRPLYEAVRTLARIRNEFAHSWDGTLDWDHPTVKKLIGQLDYQSAAIAKYSPEPNSEYRFLGTNGAVIGALHSAQWLASAPEEVQLPKSVN